MATQTMISLSILLLAFSPIAFADTTWRLCSPLDSYRVAVQDVRVNPDPVTRGTDATFRIPAITDEPISGGTVTIQVYYLGVPVHSEKDDLCSKTSCPISPGEFALINTQELPEFTPTGAYRLDLKIQDEAGDLLTCVKINFRISAATARLQLQ